MPRPIQPDGRVHGVIVACQHDDGRWLHIRRALHIQAAPGKICFPGGAVEVGEKRDDAARREMFEELGVHVQILKHVWHLVCPEKPLTLWGYLGKLTTHDFRIDPNEVHEMMWLTADEAAVHPEKLPHHEKFIAALRELKMC